MYSVKRWRDDQRRALLSAEKIVKLHRSEVGGHCSRRNTWALNREYPDVHSQHRGGNTSH